MDHARVGTSIRTLLELLLGLDRAQYAYGGGYWVNCIAQAVLPCLGPATVVTERSFPARQHLLPWNLVQIEL